MISPGIKAVVFDAVGTLIHPEPPAAIVYAQIGRRFGSRLARADIASRFTEAFRREEAADGLTGLRTSEARERARWRAIVASVLDDVSDPEACFQELFAHFARPEAWRCRPEDGPTLRGLRRRGYVLGLASNYDRRLRSVAAGLAPLKPVEHLVISSEVGWRKPARPFFDAVCQAVGTGPGRVLFVGDDPANDYEGARAAGLQAVLLDPEAKGPMTADRVTSLRELLEMDG
jgi:putative hydrolase of the HAD superfamily